MEPEKPTGSYGEQLRRQVYEDASAVLTRLRRQGEATSTKPKLVIGGLLAGGTAIFAAMSLSAGSSSPASTVPFGRDALVKTSAVGSADLTPDTSTSPAKREGPAPTPPPSPPAVEKRPSAERRPPRASGEQKEECASCRAKQEEARWETLYEEGASDGVTIDAASTPRVVVNVGSRVKVALVHPVITGASAAPVTGRIEEPVLVGGTVALPTGTQVIGEAYATESDDRVQILVSALVLNGRSMTLRGVVLGPDNQLGIRGQVLRKASKSKRSLGRVLTSVGSALTLGLIPSGGMLNAAAADMVQRAGQDLQGTAQRWVVSDKVVRVDSGSRAVVYLQADLAVE